MGYVCNFNKYEIIHEGPANKTYNTTDNSETFYSSITEDIPYVLAEKINKPVCSYVFIQTEHPKLLILETRPGNSFLQNKHLEVQNMDIFTCVNFEFIYVERHISTETNRLYHDVLSQRSILEQQVFGNTLTLAIQSPDEFAYHLMKGPGYMKLQKKYYIS